MASENSDKMTSELHTTRRILLRVAYDGTNYHGWQVQPNAKTIEGELNRVLTQLTGEKIQVTGGEVFLRTESAAAGGYRDPVLFTGGR